MRIAGNLVEGRFVARDNRFRVTVDLSGQEVWAHLPNSGRLGELLVPGCRVIVVERPGGQRKTRYDLSLVEMESRWVSVDARLPNDLVAEALALGTLHPLDGYQTVRREVAYGRSRLDFALESPGKPVCLLEVKSVTLVVDSMGCFPDAVTLRGRRHLEELADAVRCGYRAAVVFCVQRADAVGMRPHDESDPDFARTLRQAARQGVEVYAYACSVEPGHVELDRRLPVQLEPAGSYIDTPGQSGPSGAEDGTNAD